MKYSNYKNYDARSFLIDVNLWKFSSVADPDEAYDNLVSTFRNLVDKHAPLKTKVLRSDSDRFMTQELKKKFIQDQG